jgi:hypothetical protein
LEKKWLEGSTGLQNDLQGRQVFSLAGTRLGKFLATLLYTSDVELTHHFIFSGFSRLVASNSAW